MSLGACLLGTVGFAACRAAPGSGLLPPQPTAPPAELRNTRWVLQRLGGQAVPRPFRQEPHLLLRHDARQARGHGGCHPFQGPFRQPAAGRLRFGPLALAATACPNDTTAATETRFLQALAATRTYRISGDTLRLFGPGAAQPVAVLWAVYLR